MTEDRTCAPPGETGPTDPVWVGEAQRPAAVGRQAPQVSVIIAARNAEAAIARAIQSALDQPETLEVIVVNDGSTDRTSAVSRSLEPSGQRVRIIDLKQNVGPAAARNAALDQARGGLVTILDADDLMLPGRLGALIEELGAADIVADDLALSDEASPLQLRGRLMSSSGVERLSLERFAYGNIARRGERRRELGFLKPLFRRAFLDRHGLRYDASLRLGEDYILYARALALGAEFRTTPALGYVAVERDASLSGQHSTQDLGAFYEACRALSEAQGLSAEERRALAAQARSVRQRLALRMVLDIKRSRGLAQALSWLASNFADAPYVVVQIFRDKLGL